MPRRVARRSGTTAVRLHHTADVAPLRIQAQVESLQEELRDARADSASARAEADTERRRAEELAGQAAESERAAAAREAEAAAAHTELTTKLEHLRQQHKRDKLSLKVRTAPGRARSRAAAPTIDTRLWVLTRCRWRGRSWTRQRQTLGSARTSWRLHRGVLPRWRASCAPPRSR